MKQKCKSVESELSESKREATDILNQSKQHIAKMKKKFEAHQVALIKRILQFVYLKYDERAKNNESDDASFNYISFFRSITKEILANPDDFDDDDEEEEESASDNNAEEEDV